MNGKKIVALSLLTFSISIDAADYYRCTDVGGNAVFSQTSCGEDAEIKATTETSSQKVPKKKINVFNQLEAMKAIGGNSKKKQIRTNKKKGPCEGIKPLQLRNARVGGDVMKCHTKNDVLSMYGKPNDQSTRSTGNGNDNMTWRYYFKDSSSLYVYFQNDIVTDWTKHNWNKHK